MQLINFIMLKERILKNKYKKVKLIDYQTAKLFEGEIHIPFTSVNTNLSKEGLEILPKNFVNANKEITIVSFNCSDNKKEVIEKFYFEWRTF